jgi:hypothetical protein
LPGCDKIDERCLFTGTKLLLPEGPKHAATAPSSREQRVGLGQEEEGEDAEEEAEDVGPRRRLAKKKKRKVSKKYENDDTKAAVEEEVVEEEPENDVKGSQDTVDRWTATTCCRGWAACPGGNGKHHNAACRTKIVVRKNDRTTDTMKFEKPEIIPSIKKRRKQEDGQGVSTEPVCSDCGNGVPPAGYSKTQLRKGNRRRCKHCVDACPRTAVAGSSAVIENGDHGHGRVSGIEPFAKLFPTLST